MINKILLFSSVFLFLMGCQKESNEYYLYHGLKGYNKVRSINEEFVPDYGVEKIAFFQEADQLQFVLLLSENVTAQTVKNYNLGVWVYPDKKYFPEEEKVLIWDTSPELQEIGGNKYIINGFKKPIKEMDSLVFFLYDRAGYQGMKGGIISLKNLHL